MHLVAWSQSWPINLLRDQ